MSKARYGTENRIPFINFSAGNASQKVQRQEKCSQKLTSNQIDQHKALFGFTNLNIEEFNAGNLYEFAFEILIYKTIKL